ncbi:hypothetical protein DEO72_LG5g1235 [Vigna unguiculata]|uniref:Uncharacterized protein n=1 Tax=Vigna unguiculata TaxID=3917 RepID=A0A4D6LXF2_VIGUN|nr:hypothetical protein DEO72_LG5g1235 [Vigna unguiculata]
MVEDGGGTVALKKWWICLRGGCATELCRSRWRCARGGCAELLERWWFCARRWRRRVAELRSCGRSAVAGEGLAVAQGAEMVVRRSCCNGDGDCVEMVA